MWSVFFTAMNTDVYPHCLASTNLSYHQRIAFGHGLSVQDGHEWHDLLEPFAAKTSLPVMKIPTNSSPLASNILSTVNAVIKRQTTSGFPFDAYAYLVSELTDNIIQHAGTDHGWITMQRYQEQGFMDIALMDCGKTILTSYREYTGPKDFSDIQDHASAVQRAVTGWSSKNRPRSERGFGLSTSLRILVDGLQAGFILASGDAIFVDGGNIVSMPVSLPGTLIHLRLPLETPHGFSLYNLLE